MLCWLLLTQDLEAGKSMKQIRLEGKKAQHVKSKKLNMIATGKALTDMMLTYHMSYTELMDLREGFSAAAIHDPKRGAYITKSKLMEILIARFPGLERGKILDRACAVFDVDNDGRIDFEEFIIGLSRSNPESDLTTQLHFIFSLFDKDRDGDMELWELMDVIELHRDDLKKMHAFCKSVSTSIDIDGDGISVDEFMKTCETQRLFVNYCWGALPPLHPEISAGVASLVAHARAAANETDDVEDTPRDEVASRVMPAGAAPPVDTRKSIYTVDAGHEDSLSVCGSASNSRIHSTLTCHFLRCLCPAIWFSSWTFTNL